MLSSRRCLSLTGAQGAYFLEYSAMPQIIPGLTAESVSRKRGSHNPCKVPTLKKFKAKGDKVEAEWSAPGSDGSSYTVSAAGSTFTEAFLSSVSRRHLL